MAFEDFPDRRLTDLLIDTYSAALRVSNTVRLKEGPKGVSRAPGG
jgi:hypothetical protein